MAPGLLSVSVFDVLGLVGVSVSLNPLLLDLGLRAVGLVLFLALALKTRRESPVEREPSQSVSA